MTYSIVIAPTALKMLATTSDRRVREKIRDRIDGLAKDPEKQGRPLTGELTGYRSIRAVGQRYRIIYRVEAQGDHQDVGLPGEYGRRRAGTIYTSWRKSFFGCVWWNLADNQRG